MVVNKQINTDPGREEKINKVGRRGAESQDTAGASRGQDSWVLEEERPRWGLGDFLP